MSDVDQVEVVDGEPVYAVVPFTGEALSLREMGEDDIARVLDETREFEMVQMRQFKRDLQDELLRRMDAACEWTLRGAGFKLTGDSPNRHEWDVPALRAILQRLVDAGELTEDAAAKAIKVKTEYTVAASGVNALLKRGGLIATSIESCRLPSSKPRGVRVSREGL